MSDSAGSFFSRDGEWFLPTDHCRGPWAEDACHAGPPTGLLARAMERAVPDQALVRITVDLLRAIPFDGFRIDCTVLRQGRTVSTTEATLYNRDGKALVTARGMHLATRPPYTGMPTFHDDAPPLGDSLADAFPIAGTLHGLPAFNGSGVETRYPGGQSPAPGPTTAWLRTVPLLENEAPSPFQRLCPLADCGNAFGRNAEPHEVMFMNTDLTLVVHREPVGEWFATRAIGHWQPSGVGLAEAKLYDEQGAVGFALQTLILMPQGSA